MNKKYIRILSIIALIFMNIFTVTLVAFLSVVNWPGRSQSNDVSVATVVLSIILAVSGLIGIGLFFVVNGLKREPKNPVVPPPEDEGETAEPDGSGENKSE